MEYDTITRIIAGTIAIFSPARASEYLNQHRVYKLLSERKYMAAKTTGSDAAWIGATTSGAQENTEAWRRVTDKARDLARNNPYIVGARRRFRANTICEGIWPRPKIRKAGSKSKHDLEKELNQDILDRWETWAPSASANGDSIYQLQRTAVNHLFDDGQFLIRRITSRKFPYLQLQLLECDHLDTGRDRQASKGMNRIVGGIELDIFNKPVAYWLLDQHPAEALGTSKRIPAEEVIHVFDRQRTSDVTGICGYASVVQSFFRINEYAYSTMDAARIQNHFGVFIETPYVDEYGNEAEVRAGTSITLPDGVAERRYKHITPAGIHYVLPGEKPHMVKPENPGSQYGPFITKELQAASVGAGIGYESVSHDGSQTNFAGSRALLIIERAYTKMSLALLEEQMHSKVYKWFIESEISFGAPPLRMPAYDTTPFLYLRASFSRPIQEWVDPLKDVNARGERIRLGLSTLTDEAEDMGRDIEEIAATQRYEKLLGIKTSTREAAELLIETGEQEDVADQ
jgi:lambda family phage portal protein